MTLQLYLIRHGESEWNPLSRYAGQRDVPLSRTGEAQALRVAERLENERLTAIYTSPLRRAHDTALAIARRQNLPVLIEPRLAEINHGLWEGLTIDQVEAKFPAQIQLWRTQPHRAIMPHGESLTDVSRRAGEVLSDLLVAHPHGKIAICSHDAVLRVLLLQALGLPPEYFWKWEFANASLSVLQGRAGAGLSSFRLVQLNTTTHLAGVHSEIPLQAL